MDLSFGGSLSGANGAEMSTGHASGVFHFY